MVGMLHLHQQNKNKKDQKKKEEIKLHQQICSEAIMNYNGMHKWIHEICYISIIQVCLLYEKIRLNMECVVMIRVLV